MVHLACGLSVGVSRFVSLTTIADNLPRFVLVALQIAANNDPATRVLAYVTFVVAFFCLTVNQKLFPQYLDHGVDLHFAVHLLEV